MKRQRYPFCLLMMTTLVATGNDSTSTVDDSVYLVDQSSEDSRRSRPQEMGHVIRILPDIQNDKPISSLQPGYLLEMGYGDVEAGLWAELLFNRKFEPFIPYNKERDWWYWLRKRDERYRKGDLLHTDWRELEWYHSGYDHHHWYAAPGRVDDHHIHEATTFFQLETDQADVRLQHLPRDGGEDHFIRIKNRSKDQEAGMAQNGTFLRAGERLRFSGWFRSEQNRGTVFIRIYKHGDWRKPAVEHRFQTAGRGWAKKEVQLPAVDEDGSYTFAVMVSPGTAVDVDNFSLMPDSAVSGLRAETLAMLRDEVKPGVLRWPGGCFASYYDWRDGVGPLDDRPVKPSYHWGGWAYNDVGTLEYLQLCEAVGAEPFICVNVFDPDKEYNNHGSSPPDSPRGKHGYHLPEFTDLERGAKLAADWVAYCNLEVGQHPMADLRAQHGRVKPFKVTYWELENEAFRWFGAEEYARAAVVYANAMKAVDPTIKLGLCTYGKQLSQGVETMLPIAGPHIDFIADRHPSYKNLSRKLGIVRAYNPAHGTDIRYANTEHSVWLFDPEIRRETNRHGKRTHEHNFQLKHATWGYAMAWAGLLMMYQREGGDVLFSCFNSLMNTHLDSVIDVPKEGPFLRYGAAISKLFRESEARWILAMEGYDPSIEHSVQIQAAWNEDRSRLVLYFYNTLSEKKDVIIDYEKLGHGFTKSRATYLQGPALSDIRSVQQPSPMMEARVVESDVESSDRIWRMSIPACSFVEVVLSGSK